MASNVKCVKSAKYFKLIFCGYKFSRLPMEVKFAAINFRVSLARLVSYNNVIVKYSW